MGGWKLNKIVNVEIWDKVEQVKDSDKRISKKSIRLDCKNEVIEYGYSLN